MQCPVCRVDMERFRRARIQIDTCPRCRGVWLDRGELDEILRRSHAEDAGPAPVYTPPPTPGRLAGSGTPTAPAFPPPPPSPHDAGDRPHGTIWREIFDF
jgi:uncharacterized protein